MLSKFRARISKIGQAARSCGEGMSLGHKGSAYLRHVLFCFSFLFEPNIQVLASAEMKPPEKSVCFGNIFTINSIKSNRLVYFSANCLLVD